jgi:8-oxo-dGTP pyrophosphatase MutT (NUDIX family)
MIKDFSDRLYQLLMLGLPGAEAQKHMAPVNRLIQQFELKDFPNAKIGSVMILLYPKETSVHMALIKRPDYEGVHSGQISFPGGKAEPGDADEQYTALRETEEEIGVKAASIEVIGRLSNVYIPPSNFFVFPFIGYTLETPVFAPDTNEVVYVIETPVAVLLDDSNKSVISIQRPDFKQDVPCYIIEGHTVWGATAIILSELEWLLRKMQAN